MGWPAFVIGAFGLGIAIYSAIESDFDQIRDGMINGTLGLTLVAFGVTMA